MASLDAGGTAERAGLVVGDVFIRFNGSDVHKLSQKEMVQMFVKAGSSVIPLVVKTVRPLASLRRASIAAVLGGGASAGPHCHQERRKRARSAGL